MGYAYGSLQVSGRMSSTSRSAQQGTVMPSRSARACLLDHLIRLEKKRRGDGQAERLGGLEVDDQLELRGLLDRQVRRLGTLENFVRIGGSSAPLVNPVRPIGEKATNLHKLAALIHRRAAGLC